MSDFAGRDISFETLAEVCGMDITQLTRDARGQLNSALKQLRDAMPDYTDLELAIMIEDRAKAYRQLMPEMLLSPSALAKHWSALAGWRARHETYPSTPPPYCPTCDGLRLVEVGDSGTYAPCPSCNQAAIETVRRHREYQRRSPLIP